jgi:hypothetical protein
MGRYLHDIADGRPRYFVDEDTGGAPMLYSLDNQWAGYISDDRSSVYDPDGRPLFQISGDYFYGAGGVVLYSDADDEPELTENEQAELQEELQEELRREDGMRGYFFRVCEGLSIKPIILTDSQIEIVTNPTQLLSVFDHYAYYRRVGENLRDETEIDDETVHRACERARREFQQPQD